MAQERQRWLYGLYSPCTDDKAECKAVKIRVTSSTMKDGLERMRYILNDYILNVCSCPHIDTTEVEVVLSALQERGAYSMIWLSSYASVIFFFEGIAVPKYAAEYIGNISDLQDYDDISIEKPVIDVKAAEDGALTSSAAKHSEVAKEKDKSVDVKALDAKIEQLNAARDTAREDWASLIRLTKQAKQRFKTATKALEMANTERKKHIADKAWLQYQALIEQG